MGIKTFTAEAGWWPSKKYDFFFQMVKQILTHLYGSGGQCQPNSLLVSAIVHQADDRHNIWNKKVIKVKDDQDVQDANSNVLQ